MVYRTRLPTPGKLLIWGASGHALVVADIVRLLGEHEIVGFLDDVHAERAGQPFGRASILGGSDKLGALRSAGVSHALIGFGNSVRRLACARTLLDAGFVLARAVHPRAIIAGDALIGAGTVVAAGAVINPACRIGANAIVNTLASVDHECEIADGAHIGPGARVAGGVRVGRGAWVGIGATITDRVSIGAASIVGAGAVVLEDVPPGVVVYGVPARVVRTIDAG
jgi:UDP-N-acetylbacillosamine N-acetyltransferase